MARWPKNNARRIQDTGYKKTEVVSHRARGVFQTGSTRHRDGGQAGSTEIIFCLSGRKPEGFLIKKASTPATMSQLEGHDPSAQEMPSKKHTLSQFHPTGPEAPPGWRPLRGGTWKLRKDPVDPVNLSTFGFSIVT
jgi:hypothetical protein